MSVQLDYLSEVAAGNIKGRSSLIVSGLNPDVDMTPAIEDIWNLPTIPLYTFPADGQAPIDTISSSDASDKMQITIRGLDVDGVERILLPTLDGQNKVSLAIPLWRHNISINRSPTNLQGNVYIYEDTDITSGVPNDLNFVRGFIEIGDNRSFQGMNTIPAGKKGQLHWVYPFISNQISANVAIQLFTREFGGVPISSTPGGLNSDGTSFLPFLLPIPVPIEPLTDIVPKAIGSTANNIGVGINYSLVLIDE